MERKLDEFIGASTKPVKKIKELEKLGENKYRDKSWDFTTADTKILTHGLHSYPAMMIPQVARKAIELWGKGAKYILDPFMGSGTVLVEAKIHDINSYGFDINPLAVLLAKVKTTPIDPRLLKKEFDHIVEGTREKIEKLNKGQLDVEIPDYYNIDYWFKPHISKQLVLLKEEIWAVEDEDVRDFFKVAFSETVRYVSNTRNSEHKLYRIPENKLATWNPDVLQTFIKYARRNIQKMGEFYRIARDKEALAEPMFHNVLKPAKIKKIDMVLTSPPYGDSRTTVAYGQFSRLSLQWMDLDYEYVRKIDKIALGGKPTKTLEHDIPSERLDKVIQKIAEIDEKRARDVLSYFVDFYKASKILDNYLNDGGYVVFVVANRTVKGIRIPTDEIYVDMFRSFGYKHEITFVRTIPNKRMPHRVSPSNKKGETVSTMAYENIVVLRKI
ncbi:DNA methyltransferase [Thermococcus sp. MAR1]|uniref:DNA methyltransferase n=1 Tax=Thermococcus sp. MAR1 TaxID=1638263 RepID=UPI00143B8B53|nr:DNA methyltransferase [Thermococcus sp. MAR1]